MKATKVISTSIDSLNRMVVKILRLGKSDVQTSKQVSPYGFDSNPIKNMVAIHSDTGERGKTIIVGYINKNQITEKGESRIFSTDENGLLKTAIHLKNDGTIEVGGNSDFMVRYSALETAFNELQQKFNTHTHAGVTAGVGVTAIPSALSTGDITASKIEEIKTI